MSGYALHWAKSVIVEHPDLTSTERFVLYALAEHANAEHGGSWPGLKCLERETGLSRRAIYGAAARLKSLIPADTNAGGLTVWRFPADPSATGASRAPDAADALSTPVQDVHRSKGGKLSTPVHHVHPLVHHVHQTGAPRALKPKENRKEPATVPAAVSEHPAMRAQREADMLKDNGDDGAEDIAWFGNDAELRKIKPKPKEPRGSRLNRAMSRIGTG